MTQKTKHTRGPWEYDGDGFDSVAAQDFGTDGYCVFTVDKDGLLEETICDLRADTIDDDEAEANAKLIAAAPDMAEALSCLLIAIERDRDVGCIAHTDCWDEAQREWWDKIESARAALVKARAG